MVFRLPPKFLSGGLKNYEYKSLNRLPLEGTLGFYFNLPKRFKSITPDIIRTNPIDP